MDVIIQTNHLKAALHVIDKTHENPTFSHVHISIIRGFAYVIGTDGSNMIVLKNPAEGSVEGSGSFSICPELLKEALKLGGKRDLTTLTLHGSILTMNGINGFCVRGVAPNVERLLSRLDKPVKHPLQLMGGALHKVQTAMALALGRKRACSHTECYQGTAILTLEGVSGLALCSAQLETKPVYIVPSAFVV
jgi:hypothetical protein